MKITMVCAAAAALLVAGCAKSPGSIAPSYVSPVLYQDWSCKQLAQEDARLSDALVTASAQQEKARSNDIAGVILIGLPVSSMSGDNIAPEIAHLKGQQQTVQRAMITKNCRR